MMMTTDKLTYRVEEAAEQLSISRRTLYELLRTGELSSIKIGGRRIIRRTDIMEFLEGQEPAA